MSKSVNGGSAVSYTIDTDSHHLEAVGASPRTYDANGNTTAKSGHTLAYDDRNRLSDIDLGADDLAFEYNARGERVEKLFTPNGAAVQTTTYVYDEIGRLLVEKHVITGGASTLTEIVWLDDLPVGLLRNNVLYYIEPDHLGTPRQVIHPGDNEAIWRWSLLGDPFGEGAADTDPDSDSAHFTFNLRFPGQVLDAESGLHYNYFRDYDPGTGRYVESDPIGLGAGVSTFAYSHASPLRYGDPYGLASDPFGPGAGTSSGNVGGNSAGCLAGATVGAIVGGLVCLPTGVGTLVCGGIGTTIGGAILGCAAGSLVPVTAAAAEACPVDECYERYNNEERRCGSWRGRGPRDDPDRWYRACLSRAANRRNLCVRNEGPTGDEPPEWGEDDVPH